MKYSNICSEALHTSGNKRVWVQTILSTNVFGHINVVTILRAQSCMGTNVVDPVVRGLCVSVCVCKDNVFTSHPSSHITTP